MDSLDLISEVEQGETESDGTDNRYRTQESIGDGAHKVVAKRIRHEQEGKRDRQKINQSPIPHGIPHELNCFRRRDPGLRANFSTTVHPFKVSP